MAKYEPFLYQGVIPATLAALKLKLMAGHATLSVLPSPMRPNPPLQQPGEPEAKPLPPLESFEINEPHMTAMAIYDPAAEELGVQVLSKRWSEPLVMFEHGIKELLYEIEDEGKADGQTNS